MEEFISFLGPIASRYTPGELAVLREHMCILAELMMEMLTPPSCPLEG